MSIKFSPDYKIYCDSLTTGYTAGIKFSPSGALYCKNVVTGYTGIKFSPDYTISCLDLVLPVSKIVLNTFKVDTTATTLTFV